MERVLDTLVQDDFELSLRPQFLKEYIGQDDVKRNLAVFIKAAKMRDESLDHILLYGPPGLGKTTLATIVSNEMSTNIKIITGPSIERSGDLAAILSSLEPGDILFIDEIHRLSKTIEEILYPAMEDYYLDIVVGKDISAKPIRLELPPFTLIGATTRAGDLSSPLRDRFGIDFRLDFYSIEQLQTIIKRTSIVFDCEISDQAAYELAKRSRGTPRIANRLFKRVRDFAMVASDAIIELDLCLKALDALKVDSLGLDHIDLKFLMTMISRFNGGPVGLDAIASCIGEDRQTIEEVYEPYLLQQGLIHRTPRGRTVSKKAYEHLNIEFKETITK